MYTIYHIPGVKVGCTSRDPQVRVKEQGYTQFEVVEVVTGIEEASIREKFWQGELGYRKDYRPYKAWVSLNKLSNTSTGKANRRASQLKSEKYRQKQLANVKKMNTPEAKAKSANSRKKQILQFDLQGKFIKEWSAIKDAKKIMKGCIPCCLEGKQKTAAGFIWKYK